MSISYSVALLEDLGAVYRMAQAFLATTLYGQLFEADPAHLQALIARVALEGVIFVAKDEDACVGFIGVVAVEHPIDGRTYAEELAWWVEPSHRNGHVGDSLLACAEGWALQHGGGVLKMVAPAGSPRVGAYYEHLGYTPIETHYLKRL